MMHKENSILMRAPREKIFDAASDLSRWPNFLPHYRWIRYIERAEGRNVVIMAARRGWIPIQWTSEQVIDRRLGEVRFHHLKAFTKGMDVVWKFRETTEGVEVTIVHDLRPTIPLIGSFITEYIIGNLFIHYVAGQTLKFMKLHLEADGGKQSNSTMKS